MTVALGKIRVMVVNGDTTLRHGLSRILALHPGIEVVGWALSGRTALPKLAGFAPDLVLLDLEQNPAEGLELLSKLQDPAGPQRLVIAPCGDGAAVLQQAAQLGVSDVVRRPVGVQGDALVARLAQEVLPPLLRLGKRALANSKRSAPLPLLPAPVLVAAASPPVTSAATGVVAAVPMPPQLPRLPAMPRPPAVLGIGVSTGGPKALAQLLPLLPADFPIPVLVVQHMPPKFTHSLADSLDRACNLRVAEAKDHDRVERGRILIAPGGQHMRVASSEHGEVVRLSDDPPECSCRPSVDYLFRSLVAMHAGRVLGVVMTGMGEDGWIGSRLIHAAGGKILAQDEPSCAVYGMPRGPIEAGLATAVPLRSLAEAIVQVVRGVSCG